MITKITKYYEKKENYEILRMITKITKYYEKKENTLRKTTLSWYFMLKLYTFSYILRILLLHFFFFFFCFVFFVFIRYLWFTIFLLNKIVIVRKRFFSISLFVACFCCILPLILYSCCRLCCLVLSAGVGYFCRFLNRL